VSPQPGEHHRRRHFLGELRRSGNLTKLFAKSGNGCKLPLGDAGRENKVGQQRLKPAAPLLKGAGPFHPVDKRFNRRDEPGKLAEGFGCRTSQIIVGQNAVEKLILVRHGIAEQEPVKPCLP